MIEIKKVMHDKVKKGKNKDMKKMREKIHV